MSFERDGLVVIDKPAGLTSHDVVAKVRRMYKTRRVGHAGTLDPMATGLLIIGINNGTKALSFISHAKKSYTATIRLGAATVSDDSTGEQISVADATHLTDEEISKALHSMVGDIEQIPSSVSAIKVDGQRAYAKVRAGETVTLTPRRITIYAIDITAIFRAKPYVEIDVEVTCSSGTYIRAIARDLGAHLKVGGHLTALRRVESAGFTTDDCVALDDAAKGFRPLKEALARFMPELTVEADQTLQVSRGQRLPWPSKQPADPIAVLDPSGKLLAIGKHVEENNRALLAYHCVLTSEA